MCYCLKLPSHQGKVGRKWQRGREWQDIWNTLHLISIHLWSVCMQIDMAWVRRIAADDVKVKRCDFTNKITVGCCHYLLCRVSSYCSIDFSSGVGRAGWSRAGDEHFLTFCTHEITSPSPSCKNYAADMLFDPAVFSYPPSITHFQNPRDLCPQLL